MAANNLLILNATSDRPKVMRSVAVGENTYVFPLWWLLFRRLKGARIIDGSLTVSNVKNFYFRGSAGPRDLGAPVISYLLLLTIGAITLSTPILTAFSLEKIEVLNFGQLKEYLSQLVIANPTNYSKTSMSELVVRIKRSRSFEQIVRSLGRD